MHPIPPLFVLTIRLYAPIVPSPATTTCPIYGSRDVTPQLGTTARVTSRLNRTSNDGKLWGELVSDIRQQVEQIRRERLSRRISVLVGNLIGEGHFNYALVYM
ncbi:hypothetical protein EI94DRAFT_1757180 [Lactarius quietus]|nr:hypothetical protein EI94DRAFT_1757180 [Lactarius quietus]